MKKYGSVTLSILILAGLIVGTALWLRVFYTSIRTYRSPLQTAEFGSGQPAQPQTDRVVVVLISGLGYDDALALNLPVFEQLRRAGAAVAVQSIPPTYSQTAWATLITGAPPDTNDAPPFDLPQTALRPLAVDTIFTRAQQANLQTTLLGPAAWDHLIPAGQVDHTFFVDQPGPAGDQAVLEAALPVLESDRSGLLIIHFTQVDFAGQYQGGTESAAYRQAAYRIDTYLNQIRSALDLSRSVLVVLSDHGHISDGGHGGNEVEVIWQPMVMMGESIIPGNYSDIYQTDIAPTLSALLGIPPPSLAQGRVLFEMMQLSPLEQASIQMSLAQQRIALSEAYLPYLQQEEPELLNQLPIDLMRAETAFTHNNISGALQLAFLAQEEADTRIASAINSRLKNERFARLIIASLVVLVWFTAMWRQRGFHAGSIVIAALVTIALYHAIYQIQGYNYSLSSVQDFSDFPFEVARRTAVSLLAGGGIILVFLLLTNENDWLILLGTSYGYGILVTFIFALPLFWAFWQNGVAADWRLPAVVPTFWQVTGLLEVMTSAILSLLLPWPIMMLNLFVQFIRERLSGRRAQAGPSALPGLRL
jgi:hypothetical protein